MAEQKKETKEVYSPLTPDEDDPRGLTKVMGDTTLKQAIISAIVAIIIVFGMNTFIMPSPSKNTYQADITRLEKDLVAMRVTDTELNKKISDQKVQIEADINKNNSIINSLEKYITGDKLQNTLGNYPTKTELANLQDRLSNYVIKEDIKGLAELQITVKALQDKIVILEGQIVTAQTISNITISGFLSGTANSTSIFPLVLAVPITITNTGTAVANTVNTPIRLTLTLPNYITMQSATFPITNNTGNGGTVVISTTIGNLGITSIQPNMTLTVTPAINLVWTQIQQPLGQWTATWNK